MSRNNTPRPVLTPAQFKKLEIEYLSNVTLCNTKISIFVKLILTQISFSFSFSFLQKVTHISK